MYGWWAASGRGMVIVASRSTRSLASMDKSGHRLKRVLAEVVLWIFMALLVVGWIGFYFAQTIAHHFWALGAFALGLGGIWALHIIKEVRGPSAPRNVQLQASPPAVYDGQGDNAR